VTASPDGSGSAGPTNRSYRPANRSTCRQRQLIILGNRVPTVAPDTWIAPNAVVVGDVDLYEKVMQLVQPHTHVLTLQLVDWLPKHAAATGAEQIELVIAPAWHHWLCSAAQASTKLLMRDARPHGGMPPNATARRPCFSPSSLSPCHPLQTSIWYGCVLRGDLNSVKVGAFSNVQDRTVIHAAR
jgi:hypothetical protein